MEFNDIKTYLETNKDNEEVKAYLQGFKQFGVEDVAKFVSENQDGKKWFDSERDKHFTKGLETFKTNTLPKLVDEEVRKRNPSKTQAEIELEQLRAEWESSKAEAAREKLRNTAIKVANEKKISADIVDFLLGQDEESTLANISKYEQSNQQYIQAAIEERIKSGSYTPPKNSGNGGAITLESLKTMSADEINKNWDAVQQVLSQQKQ